MGARMTNNKYIPPKGEESNLLNNIYNIINS